MTSVYRFRRTPELPLDNPSFIEEQRSLKESIEAITDSGEFPRRDYDMDSSMETYESGRDALFYE
ncbi:MAG TPA: hypothetical protein VJC07_05005 [Candidatus Nanoarchaeia archaeon]|nr:hypothetical protein [Candidatus Nanoarchaeia archaeon]